MHKLQLKIKAFVFCLALILPVSLGLAAAHSTTVKATNGKTVASQEAKKKDTQATAQKPAEKTAETKATADTKTPESPKPAPAPVTPDKKKYASPNGYQVMTDGTVIDFRSAGVIYMYGYRYSYYSSNVLNHHSTSSWYNCDDHLYRTADGYIVVASGDHARGAIVPTPFGKGKVMDHCYASGTIDIYTSF